MSELTQYLTAALEDEYGIKVFHDDPWQLRQQLYKAKYEAKNPEFDVLTFRVPPFSKGELWIIKSNGAIIQSNRGRPRKITREVIKHFSLEDLKL